MDKTRFWLYGWMLLFAGLLLCSTQGWAQGQELTGSEARKTNINRVEENLKNFYDLWLGACVGEDEPYILSIAKNYTYPNGVFKPDFGKFPEDGLWKFNHYCTNFRILYQSIYEEPLEFKQSDFHFIYLRSVNGGDSIETDFTFQSKFYSGERLITSAEVEAVMVFAAYSPANYKIKQIVPIEPVTVHYSPEEEKQTPKAETPVVVETPKEERTPVVDVSDLRADGVINGHEYVDLGLSVMWATCNVGASKPSDYGDYFAWGEIKPKNEYTKWNSVTWEKGGGSIAGNPQYDAARHNWGGEWRLPTRAEFEELYSKTKMEWTICEGHVGYKITGPSGNSIFIPSAGVREELSLRLTEIRGNYWSSISNSYDTQDAYGLGFGSTGCDELRAKRYVGLSIRPVIKIETSENQVGSQEEETFTVNGVSFTMVYVEGGTFSMGATSEQENPDSDEKPVHSVTLSSYSIGQTEVTQALWKAVMGSNPSCFKGDNLPVERVFWNDCQTFIRKLNALTGRTFRLPTEAEWEFAARGGNESQGYQYSGSNNLGNVAWYSGNADEKTHPVATKSANELGLYDMSGNVWEWCQDWKGSYSSSSQTNPTGPSSGSYHVLRGGGWFNISTSCRVAYRNDYTASNINYNGLGFRLALSSSH